MEGIISFAPSVEDTFLFSEIVLMIVPQNEVLEMIELLSDGNYNSFRLLLIEKLTSKEILSFVKNNLSKRLPILAEHFVDNKIITFVDQLMEVDQKYYWEKVSISGCHELNEKNFRKYINGLQTNGRYADSIHVLAYCLDKDNLDVDILINTLMQFAKPADYELSAKQSFGHDINEIIGFLQINASDRKDEIIKLEKKFIQELYPRGITYPKFIYDRIANDPEYVYKLIVDEYENNKSAEYTGIVDNLLYHCRIAPGSMMDGTFDFDVFKNWKEFADSVKEQSIKEKMNEYFVKMTLYTLEDKKGFIVNKCVADYIENGSDDLKSNIYVALFNNVGRTGFVPESGGPQKVVNELMEKSTFFMNEGYIDIAKVYRDVADIIDEHFKDNN